MADFELADKVILGGAPYALALTNALTHRFLQFSEG